MADKAADTRRTKKYCLPRKGASGAMQPISPEEFKFMREKKIYLCSFCMYCPRQKDKNTYYCVAGKAWRVYCKMRECPGFRPKPKKPEPKAEQLRMFDDWGHAAPETASTEERAR